MDEDVSSPEAALAGLAGADAAVRQAPKGHSQQTQLVSGLLSFGRWMGSMRSVERQKLQTSLLDPLEGPADALTTLLALRQVLATVASDRDIFFYLGCACLERLERMLRIDDGLVAAARKARGGLESESFARCVGALPDAAFKACTERRLLEPFAPDRYWGYVAKQVMKMSADRDVDAEVLHELSKKMIGVGHGSHLASEMIERNSFEGARVLYPATKTILWRQIILSAQERPMDSTSFQCILNKLLTPQEMEEFLVFLFDNMLFHRKLKNRNIIWALILFAHEHDDEFLNKAKRAMLDWSSKDCVLDSDKEEQSLKTGIVYTILSCLTSDQIQSGMFPSILMSGVQQYLESTIPETRRLGMWVAELFASQVSIEPGLSFDELKGDNQGFIFAPPDTPHFVEEKLPEESGQNRGEGEDVEVLRYEIEENPGDEKDVRPSIWSDSSSGEEADSDDDEFEPIIVDAGLAEKVGTLEKQKKAQSAPHYVSDALEDLKGDSYERFMIALQDFPNLVKIQPADCERMCCEAARTILHLDNKFGMENFGEWQTQALVCLGSNFPIQVIPLFASEALNPKATFMTLRATALEAISQSAESLSGAEMVSADEESLHRAKARVVSRPIGTVTRHLGVRKRPEGKKVINRYATLASSAFFNPLINGIPGARDHLQREPSLMSRLLFVLSNLVRLAKTSPYIHHMSRTLARLLWPTRLSNDPEVRRTVLFGFIRILSSTPVGILQDDPEWLGYIAGIREEVRVMKDQDPDSLCRQHATLLSSLLA